MVLYVSCCLFVFVSHCHQAPTELDAASEQVTPSAEKKTDKEESKTLEKEKDHNASNTFKKLFGLQIKQFASKKIPQPISQSLVLSSFVKAPCSPQDLAKADVVIGRALDAHVLMATAESQGRAEVQEALEFSRRLANGTALDSSTEKVKTPKPETKTQDKKDKVTQDQKDKPEMEVIDSDTDSLGGTTLHLGDQSEDSWFKVQF